MSDTADIRDGQCLCGAVSFHARLPTHGIHACHCTQCQRWTGGCPLLVVSVEDPEIKGKDALLRYEASGHGERAVCGQCGSTIWWRMQGRTVKGIALGLLNDQSGLRVTEEIFVDYRPDWFKPFEGASQSTEAEEFKKLDAFLASQRSY
jgi:hypothetical protein